jgi:predicted dehydrogenase/threonine dehydrogenase-like Zn-dependent dehydrogenase
VRLVQSVRSGELRLEQAASPTPGPTQVLVRTQASLISAGTEKSLRTLASASLLAKARARPDLVRQVIDRAKKSGLRSTARAVRSRLSEDMPLGYSAAGIVEAVGESVAGIRPGQRVATAGAPHADIQAVAGTLVAALPDSTSFEDGAFATVASIALNGLRLSSAGPGTTLVIVGLGLVGQLTARLAIATGARVVGVEPESWKRNLAAEGGVAAFDADQEGWDGVAVFTRGVGADAAIVTAATSSSDPVSRAAEATGDQGIVVLVGEAGMNLSRRPFYERELTLRVARSYGPGRYDPTYEDLGIDYPRGHVRWTAQRNMEAVLDLIGSGRVDVSGLITHRYPFSDALAAYSMLESRDEHYLGIILNYGDRPPDGPSDANRIRVTIPASAEPTAGLIGVGRFARETLVPAAAAAGFQWSRIFSATGTVAHTGDLESAIPASDPAEILAADDTPVVFIATRHDSHAMLTSEALRAGKHVFCEKPLALSESELADVRQAWEASSGSLMVGFNRRWSPAVAAAKDALRNSGPLQLVYRVSAGALPEGHWLADRRMGGRMLGEACHFVDTCSAIVGDNPASVTALTAGTDELLLDQDFSILLGYPDGSQASIVYASHASSRPGKERLEIMGGGYSIVIDDYQSLEVTGPRGHKTTRYRPEDKGHTAELIAFAEVVRGDRDGAPLAASAFSTSEAMFAAVESAMTGSVVRPGA